MAEVPIDQGYTGLVNLRNTCYLNAMVQCLYHTRPLRQYFNSRDFDNELMRLQNNQVVLNSAFHLGVVINQMTSFKFSSVKLTDFIQQFRVGLTNFNPHQQHDTVEFIGLLMRRLEQDMLRPEAVPPQPSNNPYHNELIGQQWLVGQQEGSSIFRQLFFIQDVRQSMCPHCSQLQIPAPDLVQAITTTLYLPLDGSDTLEALIERWHGPTIWDCNVCTNPAQEMHWFWRVPPILIIQLGRSDRIVLGTDLGTKNLTPIKITEDILDLTPYIHPSVVIPNESYDYRLYAMIHHEGENIIQGHYYAFANGYPKGWRKYNDRIVRDVDQDQVFSNEHVEIYEGMHKKQKEMAENILKPQKDVYVLFYERLNQQ